MKYAMLIYETSAERARGHGDTEEAKAYWGAWEAYSQAIADAGVSYGGAGLQEPDTATTLRLNGDAERQVQDGPYADSKEMLAGFFLIDVPDLDTALDWASRLPAHEGSIEIRPLLDM
ncbi:MAG: YciI family protein [Acidobacteriota bacterium]